MNFFTLKLTILQSTNLAVLFFKVLTDLLCRFVVAQRLEDCIKNTGSSIFSASNVVTLGDQNKSVVINYSWASSAYFWGIKLCFPFQAVTGKIYCL